MNMLKCYELRDCESCFSLIFGTCEIDTYIKREKEKEFANFLKGKTVKQIKKMKHYFIVKQEVKQ